MKDLIVLSVAMLCGHISMLINNYVGASVFFLAASGYILVCIIEKKNKHECTWECKECDYVRYEYRNGKRRASCALDGKCKDFADYYKGVWDNVYKMGYAQGYQECEEKYDKPVGVE